MPTAVASRDIFVQANGLRHHLIARGMPGAPVVMMIHGLAGQAHVFDSIASRLSTKYHVYALDVRGRGESEWGPPDGYHVGNYIEDLESVRENLGLTDLALVGTSMGGIITMHYAAAYPEHVTRAAVNDIGPEIDPTGLKRILSYVGDAPTGFPDMKAVLKYYRENYGPMVEHLPEDQVADFARWNVRKDQGIYVWKMDPAIRNPSAAPPPRDPWDAYKAMQCPVLILRGAQSDILSRDIADRMLAANPNASLTEVPGVGHAPMLLEPESIRALESFLAG
jgi:pimeloyl-ACP methyl ester carboxylesterase